MRWTGQICSCWVRFITPRRSPRFPSAVRWLPPPAARWRWCRSVEAPLQPEPRGAGDCLVVGMDGSPQSLDAFRWACGEAARRGLPLRVVVVSPTETVLDTVTRTVAARLRMRPTVAITLLTRAGDPGPVLIEESKGCEALILGQHGSGTIRRRLPSLGSVSRWCVAHLVSPVVVVPRRPRRARQDKS